MTEEYLNKYAHDKHLPADFYSELCLLDLKSKEKLVELLELLSPSANALQGIYRLANEIIRREGFTFVDLFSSDEITSVLLANKLSRKEKTTLLRKRLEELRFPEKHQIVNTAHQLVDEIKKTYAVKLSLPDELEGEVIDFSFSIKSQADLENKISNLISLKDSGQVSALFDILLGRV